MLKTILYIIGGFFALGIIGFIGYAGFIYFIFSKMGEDIGEAVDLKKSNEFYFSKDNKKIFFVFNGETKSAVGALTTNLDPAKVRVIDTYFATDGKLIYFRDRDVTTEIGQMNQFRNLKGYYYTDDESIYYLSNSLKFNLNSKMHSKINSELIEKAKIFDQHIVYDGRVYFREEPIAEADAKTFAELENKVFGKDNRSVYFESKKIPRLDPVAVRFLNPGHTFTTDGQRVFEGVLEIPLPGLQGLRLDTKNFYARLMTDTGVFVKNHNYINDEIEIHPDERPYIQISNADPKTFEVIKNDYNTMYAKDKNSIFYGDYKVVNFDVEGFELPAPDSLIVYLGHQEVEILPSSAQRKEFEFIDETGYLKRKDGDIYYRFIKMNPVDRASFKVLSRQFAKDATGYFYGNTRITDTPMTDELARQPDLNFRRVSFFKYLTDFTNNFITQCDNRFYASRPFTILAVLAHNAS